MRIVLWSIFSFIIFLFIVAGYFYFQFIVEGLPTLEDLENPKQSLASIVYSADDVEIGRFFKQRRIEISIDSIPVHLVEALVSTEDKKFYDHWGMDLRRFTAAVYSNIVHGFGSGGASTL
ncbi:MAG: transglycosylase domain-containing protein, partial [Candidatus Delongbacteria bacterium]|nr:transglycosylase domain-containing protein [Candidatus Delongbacteria bacterium]